MTLHLNKNFSENDAELNEIEVIVKRNIEFRNKKFLVILDKGERSTY